MALILIGDKVWAPMDFSYDATKGYQVPKVWGCGRCQIILHASEAGPDSAADTFTLALVAHVAANVVVDCVVDRPSQLGGYARLGPKKIFEVVVGPVLDAPNGSCHIPYSKNISSIHSAGASRMTS